MGPKTMKRGRPGWVRLVPVLLVALIAAACGSAAPAANSGTSGGKVASNQPAPLLKIGIPYTVSSLNPGGTTNTGAGYLDLFGLEFLMKLTKTGKVTGFLAKSYTLENPTTYVFHLRPGVKFWDGSPLTAADVAFSLNYERNPKLSPLDSPEWVNVKNVVASGTNNVTITLATPDAGFPGMLTWNGWIFEKKFYEAHTATFGQPGTLIMGTGPYEYSTLNPTTGADLTANPNYWGGKNDVPAKKISVSFFTNQTSMALAFRAGEIDLALPASPKAWAATSGTTPITIPSCNLGFFSMDTQEKPFNNIHVRKAVEYAINRQGIIAAEGGFAEPAYSMIPNLQLETIASKAQVNSLEKSLNMYPFDVAKAKAQMKMSPYPNGVSVTLYTFNYSTFPQVDQAIAQMLGKVGINVDVKVLPQAQYGAKLQGPKDGVLDQYTYYYCQSSDPGYIPALALTSQTATLPGENLSDYANPAADKLITEGLTETSPSARFRAYSKLAKLVNQDAAYVAIYNSDNTLAIDSKFTWPDFNAFSEDHIPYITQVRAVNT